MFRKKYIWLLVFCFALSGCGKASKENEQIVEEQPQEVKTVEESQEEKPEEVEIEELPEPGNAEKQEEPAKSEEPEEEIMDENTVTNTEGFYSLEFDETSDIFARIKGKSYKDNCTVPVSDLRYLHVMHIGFDGQPHEGEIICNKYISEDLLEIFKDLYVAKYPIEKIKLVDEYDADDESSMADNNSSSFNFRFISYTTKISKHGYGLAMDINTLYNPYVKTVNGQLSIEPANATAYVDRSQDFPHKIDENDLAYKLFTEHGFEWGGAWKKSKDYQHFEVPDSVVKKLYN
ncbi:M15 family metallopeptidase [Pseudobutyrivibrio xylanivorans]|uniref:D-alanyl-D-alanine carboxypeptidase n=1 Tax=Pseudobutyrivibrio xylanivorans TaxID=185007 RepID=A0A1G5RSD3_PSEXY|nr:M15 family metallopeptidase [Pseudobutyrivibrio xylanivorans]SCZ77015.1 D-alanyl-D-alanine carboxypeptidase [Pseudobutyrivibrio xylanivorans]